MMRTKNERAIIHMRDDDPARVVTCNDCLYDWEEAGAEEAMRAFRAQLFHINY